MYILKNKRTYTKPIFEGAKTPLKIQQRIQSITLRVAFAFFAPAQIVDSAITYFQIFCPQ